MVNVRALLYKVARNLIADYYRSRPEARGVGFVGGDGDSVTFEHDATSYSVEPAEGRGERGWDDKGRGRDMIEARAELSLILEKFESPKEDYRDVVTFRLVDGLAFEERSTFGWVAIERQGYLSSSDQEFGRIEKIYTCPACIR